MKKILRLVAFSAVAGLVVFASCKKEDESPSYADGWTDAKVEEAKEGCAQSGQGLSEETCDCVVDKVSKNIPYNQFDDESKLTEENEIKFYQYVIDCGGLDDLEEMQEEENAEETTTESGFKEGWTKSSFDSQVDDCELFDYSENCDCWVKSYATTVTYNEFSTGNMTDEKVEEIAKKAVNCL